MPLTKAVNIFRMCSSLVPNKYIYFGRFEIPALDFSVILEQAFHTC